MVTMLGDRVLPSSVQRRRQNLRSRVLNVREPIRQLRKETVPGPDVIGTVEGSATDLRDRFVDGGSPLDAIKDLRSDDSSSGSGQSGSSSSNGQNKSRGRNTNETSLV